MPIFPIPETRPIEILNRSRPVNLTPVQKRRFYDDDLSQIAVTVGMPIQVAFSFFRDFKNLPLFMKDLKSIVVLSPTRSQWTVEIKGLRANWDAQIINERKDEMIAWKSIEGSEVQTSGTIWFYPAPEALGTVISLILDYKLPGGKLTDIFTKMVGEDPKSLAFINLRRLKCFLETGEIATIEGQSDGRDPQSENILKH